MSDLLKTAVALVVVGAELVYMSVSVIRSWMKDFVNAIINRETIERYPNKKERYLNYTILVLMILAWFGVLMLCVALFIGFIVAFVVRFKYGISV
jgi:hypothetical protein